jgi:uncharacterized protein (UPF0332 family)
MININRIINDKDYCKSIYNFYFKNNVIKTSEINFFKKHIDKSINNLLFANFLMEEHDYSIKQKLHGRKYYDWCINIYYYSLYHAALALLEKIKLKSKNHTATITALCFFYYHKNKLLNHEEIKLISRINLDEINLILFAKELREKASYGVISFEKEQAEILKIKVIDFINKSKEILLA